MRLTRILSVLFFLSGIPALVYQLVWQRALFRIFGVNIESVTVVVTAFMLGLGLGSLAGGWLSTRRNLKLLPLLAAMEIAIGLFGLQSLAIFAFVGDRVVGLPLAAIATVALALVVVPTVLMGATLPLLVAHLVRHTRNVEIPSACSTTRTLLARAQRVCWRLWFCFPFSGCRVRFTWPPDSTSQWRSARCWPTSSRATPVQGRLLPRCQRELHRPIDHAWRFRRFLLSAFSAGTCLCPTRSSSFEWSPS